MENRKAYYNNHRSERTITIPRPFFANWRRIQQDVSGMYYSVVLCISCTHMIVCLYTNKQKNAREKSLQQIWETFSILFNLLPLFLSGKLLENIQIKKSEPSFFQFFLQTANVKRFGKVFSSFFGREPFFFSTEPKKPSLSSSPPSLSLSFSLHSIDPELTHKKKMGPKTCTWFLTAVDFPSPFFGCVVVAQCVLTTYSSSNYYSPDRLFKSFFIWHQLYSEGLWKKGHILEGLSPFTLPLLTLKKWGWQQCESCMFCLHFAPEILIFVNFWGLKILSQKFGLWYDFFKNKCYSISRAFSIDL